MILQTDKAVPMVIAVGYGLRPWPATGYGRPAFYLALSVRDQVAAIVDSLYLRFADVTM